VPTDPSSQGGVGVGSALRADCVRAREAASAAPSLLQRDGQRPPLRAFNTHRETRAAPARPAAAEYVVAQALS